MDFYEQTISSSKQIDSIRSIITQSRFFVAVTGAGISVASGLPLLDVQVEGLPLREVFRSRLLLENPRAYYEVYRNALQGWLKALPNPAHGALARSGAWVVTQNIDGLHRDSGSAHLIELHGNLRELRCQGCNGIFSSDLAFQQAVPECPGCKKTLFPGFTLEGGKVRHFSLASDWVGRAEVLLIVGTQLAMEPVRQLPNIARRNGAAVYWVSQQAEHILPELLKPMT